MVERFLEDHPRYRSHLTNEAQYPTAINMELTTKCNLRCIMCPKTAGQPRTTPDRTMDEDIFTKILDEVVPNVFRVDVVGDGEVLLARSLLERLLARCKDCGVLVNICTNGLLLTPTIAEMLINYQLADMNVSMDAATAQTYQSVRGASFSQLLRNLQTLNDLKRAAASEFPRLHFTMVGMAMNIDEFPDLVNLASTLNGASVTLQAMGEFEAVRNQSVYLRDPERGRRAFEQGKKLGAKLGISVGLWPESQFETHATSSEQSSLGPTTPESHLRKDCDFPWDVPYFTTTGDVLPCCAMTPMGTLHQHSFDDIWSGNLYRELRAAIKSANPPERCVTCPGRGWFSPTIAIKALRLGATDRQLGLGWYNAETDSLGKGFRWTRERATIFLAKPETAPQVLLTIELGREPHPKACGTGEILAHGQPVGKFYLEGDGPTMIGYEIPWGDADDLIRVDVKPDFTWRPCDLFPNNRDLRRLGVKVYSANLIRTQGVVTFAHSLQFLAFESNKTPDGNLQVLYVWRCLKPVDQDYAVFVHIVKTADVQSYNSVLGKLKRKAGLTTFVQHDHEPVNGLRKTSTWQSCEIISESHTVQVPPDLPPADYAVLVGLWSPKTGARLEPIAKSIPIYHRAAQVGLISLP